MAEKDLGERVAALERILGLQRLGGGEVVEEEELAGLSTQSVHCGGSALSIVCVAPEELLARLQK
jgi:hypothetical protein